MSNNVKTPDRLNYTRKAQEIVSKIDETKFMGLNFPTTTRSDLFMFAMAFGINTGVSTKLQNTYPGGLVLDSSIDGRTKALLYAFSIGSNDNPDVLDYVTSKDKVYTAAQELANTGFDIIDDYMATKKETSLLWTLIEELDEQYNEMMSSES